MQSISKLSEILKDEPSYRYEQVNNAIFNDLIGGWQEAMNLPAQLREILKEEFPLLDEGEVRVITSHDINTQKALVTLVDGSKIESVLMMYGNERNTVCVSTQVGCSMGCAFCATGKLGLARNLTDWEIVEQVLVFARQLKASGQKVSNIVFMGMGEPFENYDNVMSAVRVLNDKKRFGLGARRISISTCGLVPEILRFSEENIQANLAVSLHAANDELRKKLMPIAYRYDLTTLMRSIDEYIRRTNRKVMFEYILLEGINDDKKNAEELVALLRGKLCMINLIEYNDTGDFRSSPTNITTKFKRYLLAGGLDVTQRYRFGTDIKAACGQLAGGS